MKSGKSLHCQKRELSQTEDLYKGLDNQRFCMGRKSGARVVRNDKVFYGTRGFGGVKKRGKARVFKLSIFRFWTIKHIGCKRSVFFAQSNNKLFLF